MARKQLTKEAKAAMFWRFREQLGKVTDVELTELMDKNTQQIYNYKTGRDCMGALEMAQRFPHFDWNYILTGVRSENKVVMKELFETRSELNKLANNLQKIEELYLTK